MYADANGNGALDASETATATNADGDYSLQLRPGTYDIRVVLQSGWVGTAPSRGVYSDVQLVSGVELDGKNFGVDQV